MHCFGIYSEVIFLITVFIESFPTHVFNYRMNGDSPQRYYKGNAPKILLETISARTAMIILTFTYASFGLGFLFDLRSTMLGFSSGIKYLSSDSCVAQNISVGYSEFDYGCVQTLTSINDTTETVWVGHIEGLRNVISVAIQAKLTNVTSVTDELISDDDDDSAVLLSYDVELYACHKAKYCGYAKSQDNRWNKVLTLENRKVYRSDFANNEDDSLKIHMLPNTFQNQESLPDNGRVRSYMAFVSIHNHLPQAHPLSRSLEYKFATINRPSLFTARIMLQFCVAFTLTVIGGYYLRLRKVYRTLNRALPIQRWVLWYMVMLLLFQNPVYCVISWSSDPQVEAVFTAYVLDAFAQSGFFTLWLVFADGLQNHLKAPVHFYTPKFLMGFLIFALNLGIIVVQFPTVFLNASSSAAVEASSMWSEDKKVSLIVFSLSFLSLLWIWTLWWFYDLWFTAKKLRELPYMHTRYLQLWFRFFLLQATFVALYYVFQYFVAIYYILHYQASAKHTTVQHIADDINTLFRQQSFNFGKVVFLTTYGTILAFFALPAPMVGEDAEATVTAVSVTYVLSEAEIAPMHELRLKAIQQRRAISALTSANPHVFCVDLARELMEVAYQAYYDPPDCTTQSGYGAMSVLELGYILAHYAYDAESDTVCFIFRHLTNQRLVVAFRGTCSKKHWAANLKYQRIPLDIEKLGMEDLDAIDGFQEGESAEEPIAAPLGMFERTLSTFGIYNFENNRENTNEKSPRTPSPASNKRSFLRALLGCGFKTAKGTISKIPVLSHTVQTEVHRGFWEAYASIRYFLHTAIRQELLTGPADVICVGHSLGGALATFAALDLAVHTIPRVNVYLNANPKVGIQHVSVSLYNYGSPRVGNLHFSTYFNSKVPNSFRVAVDGDIVTGVPKSSQRYRHVGVEVTVDAWGTGSIIIDPSFVETWLRMQSKTSLSAHSLGVYRLALFGVKAATEFMRSCERDVGERNEDIEGQFDANAYAAAEVQLALQSARVARTLTKTIKYDIESVMSSPLDDQQPHDTTCDSTGPSSSVLQQQKNSDRIDNDTNELVMLVEAQEGENNLLARASMRVRDITNVLTFQRTPSKQQQEIEIKESDFDDH